MSVCAYICGVIKKTNESVNVTILNWPGVSVNNAYRVDQKSKPAYCCNNFVYFQPVFVILARVHCKIFATGRCIVSPPNTICETLPCKIFITTLFMFRSKFYRLSLLIPSRRNVQYLTSPHPTKYKTSRKKIRRIFNTKQLTGPTVVCHFGFRAKC